MAKWVFVNNYFIEEDDAKISFRDLSFLRGYGIFDFFRLTGNEPVFLDDHLDRFFSSADGLHLKSALSKDELKRSILELVKKNNLPDTGIRIGLTGGYSADGFTLGEPNLVISQHNFSFPKPEEVENGIRLMLYTYKRQLPHIKSIDYLTAIWLQPDRLKHAADDILYHQDGIISECPRSNFFLVTKENTLITPSEGALHGITRKKIIELAKNEFEVEERQVTLTDLLKAKEAFITSTTKRILPVRRVDETVFESTKISRYLLNLFRQTYHC